jgi:hypothetical protein
MFEKMNRFIPRTKRNLRNLKKWASHKISTFWDSYILTHDTRPVLFVMFEFENNQTGPYRIIEFDFPKSAWDWQRAPFEVRISVRGGDHKDNIILFFTITLHDELSPTDCYVGLKKVLLSDMANVYFTNRTCNPLSDSLHEMICCTYMWNNQPRRVSLNTWCSCMGSPY